MTPPPGAAVLFRSSPTRLALLLAGLAVAVWGVLVAVMIPVSTLVGASLGGAVDFWLTPQAPLAGLAALAVPYVRMLRRPHRVRACEAGVELGTTYARSVLVPWSDLESATVHGRSILATLHVAPRAGAGVTVLPGPGRPPATRRCAGRDGYCVAAGLFPGGAARALAALQAPAKIAVRSPSPGDRQP